jgi:hypothetical protein
MSDTLTVSPYLRPALDRSYRDVLDAQIARLEAERQRIGDQLVVLRKEWERLGSQMVTPTDCLATS